MKKNLAHGDLAPHFTLSGHDGAIYSLEETLKKGPVLLLFYPYDQSPNCTRRLCSINVLRDEYASEGITVLGINNRDQESHENFAQKAELTMPLLSDTDFSVARSYNALFEVGPIRVMRTTVVAIGRDGRIRFYKHGELPQSEKLIALIR